MSPDAPIFSFNEARPSIVDEVVRRTVHRVRDPMATLSDAVYHEVKRLTSSRDGGGELSAWRSLARRLPTLSAPSLHEEVRRLAETHAWDVAGNFDPKVYAVATRLMPPVLGAIVAPFATATSLRRLVDAGALADRIAVEGHVAHVRRLADRGTIVYVPTHLSNMDSIVFGYALERAGLPPATYGAGKNLFTNPVLSFFMHNLGAYKVDRRLRHALYKDVLKAYSCVLIERGYHSLFFPGGTRSRSGGVERRLKLGLAGTGVEAFARTAAHDPERPRHVFFVPATISYLVTLEAETLIEDFLQEAGKTRYIIEDDESSRIEKVASFINKLLRHDGGVVIRFGEPLDPFGNRVDDEGRSLDGHGRVVDPISYVKSRTGEIVVDADRDAQYTRELGDAVCDSYLRNTVILPTHVVATVLMNQLRRAARTDDLFALVKVRERVATPRGEVARETAVLRDKLLALEDEGRIVVGPGLRGASGDAILREALRGWEGTHSTHVVEEQAGELWIGSPGLVFYYQNRLAAHGLALDVLAPKRGQAAA
jgi:glycerol-3-phosphate O-acyltransferase